VESSFTEPFQAPCLRCGTPIAVTSELIHQTAARSAKPAARPALEEAIIKGPSDDPPGPADAADEVREEAKPRKVRSNAGVEYDLSVRDLWDEPEDEGNGREKRPKRQAKSASRGPRRGDDDDEAIDAEDDDPGRHPSTAKPSATKTSRPRWPIIAAIAAVVLVVGGSVGAVLIFSGGDKKKETPKTEAKKTTPKQKVVAQAPPPPEKKVEPPPAPKSTGKVEFVLSAPRLSAELAANPVEANIKYGNTVVEVTGLFERLEKKEGLDRSVKPHALFKTVGTPIYCDLTSSPTTAHQWNGLRPGNSLTVRAVYAKSGFLQSCTRLPLKPPADDKYKGKLIEVGLKRPRLPVQVPPEQTCGAGHQEDAQKDRAEDKQSLHVDPQ
jgi:hypothetical protein